MNKILFSLLISLMLIGGITIGEGIAQAGAPPDININLGLDKTAYILSDLNDPANTNYPEPINITITLENTGAGDVITSDGFSPEEGPGGSCSDGIDNDVDGLVDSADPDCNGNFHLLLTFIGPDGKGITANLSGGGGIEGPPPHVILPEEGPGGSCSDGIDNDGDGLVDSADPDCGEMVQVEPVEVLPGTANLPAFILSVTLPNAYTYYALTESGNYSVKATIPMRTYSAIYKTVGGVDYASIDSVDWSGALKSNTVNFSLVADADGDDYSYPVVHPQIASFLEPDCDDGDSNINPGAAEIRGNGIDEDCDPSNNAIPPGTIRITADLHTVGSGSRPESTKDPINGLIVRAFDKTDPSSCVYGFADFGVSWQNYKSIWLSCVSQGDGITGADGTVSIDVAPGDYVVIGEYDTNTYIGVSARGIESDMTTEKYLQVIIKDDGKKVPAKYTKKTGSELLIIEPEYVEWDGTQELYPFVFDSLGDWSVTTSVSPPEGFVTDNDSLTEDVYTELEALQFTITDIGSDWVDTVCTHEIKHKGKKEKIKTRIGVKLSKKLAKKKGLDRFGKEKKKQE